MRPEPGGRRTAAIARRRGALLAASLALIVSCEGTFGPETLAIGRVEVSPTVLALVISEARPVTARVFDDGGGEIAGRRLFWSSRDPSIATVTPEGVVTAVSAGATEIAASSGGQSAIVAVTSLSRPLVLIRVLPGASDMTVGSTLQLNADAIDAGGAEIEGQTFEWSTSDPAVATVNGSGRVTAIAPGNATIRARVGSVEGSAVISVRLAPVAQVEVAPSSLDIDVGASATLTATPRDAGGQPLTGRQLTWRSSSESVATVSSSGVVTGVAPGNATITVSAPGAGSGGSTPSTNVPVTVRLAPVARVQISPAGPSVPVGRTVSFSVSLFDADNDPLSLTGRTVTWSSSAPTVATINAGTGVATGVALGTATITATVATQGRPGTVAGTTVLAVINAPVATVQVSPNPGTVFVGAAYASQFSAQPRDAQGNVLTGRSVVWTSLDTDIATVNASTGVVSGVGPGNTRIRATSEGVDGFADVAVTLVPVASVTVSPPSATLTPPQTQQLSATPRDQQGLVIAGVALGGRTTTWSSTATSVATVNGSGLVTAVGAGTATIQATIGGTSGGSTITVNAATGAVVVAIDPDSIIGTGSLSGTVTVTSTGGQPMAGQTVTIGTSDPLVATPLPLLGITDAQGEVAFAVTALLPGSATITAAAGGQNGQRTVRVLSPVGNVSVSPATETLNPTESKPLMATVTLAGGGPAAGRVCSVGSTNAAAVGVAPSGTTTTDANGQVPITITGVASGSATITVTCEGQSGSASVNVP